MPEYIESGPTVGSAHTLYLNDPLSNGSAYSLAAATVTVVLLKPGGTAASGSPFTATVSGADAYVDLAYTVLDTAGTWQVKWIITIAAVPVKSIYLDLEVMA